MLCIQPGEQSVYFWEEPMQQRKLSIRVEVNRPNTKREDASSSMTINKNNFRSTHGEYQGHYGPCKTIKLEVVGFREKLPCPGLRTGGLYNHSSMDSENFLHCQVDIEGVTRVLIITESQNSSYLNILRYNFESVSVSLKEEESRSYQFQNILQCIEADKLLDNEKKQQSILEISPRANSSRKSRGEEKKVSVAAAAPSPQQPIDSEESSQDRFNEKEYSDFVEKQITIIASDYPEDCTITKCNQLFVQIIEAAGLKSSGVSGLANPYCEISFKNLVKTKDRLNKQKQLTYFVEKSICPKWLHQYFIFQVRFMLDHESINIIIFWNLFSCPRKISLLEVNYCV